MAALQQIIRNHWHRYVWGYTANQLLRNADTDLSPAQSIISQFSHRLRLCSNHSNTSVPPVI